jgi:hypothetical protein
MEHPDVVSIRSNYANALMDENPEEAKKLLESVLKQRLTFFGSDSMPVAWSYGNLGVQAYVCFLRHGGGEAALLESLHMHMAACLRNGIGGAAMVDRSQVNVDTVVTDLWTKFGRCLRHPADVVVSCVDGMPCKCPLGGVV